MLLAAKFKNDCVKKICWHSFSLTLGTVGTGINGSGIVGGGGGIFTDEHSLIAQYCQKLHNGDLISAVPDSPLTLMAEIDAEQRHELELMIRELETENATLQVRTIDTFKSKSGIFHQNLA